MSSGAPVWGRAEACQRIWYSSSSLCCSLFLPDLQTPWEWTTAGCVWRSDLFPLNTSQQSVWDITGRITEEHSATRKLSELFQSHSGSLRQLVTVRSAAACVDDVNTEQLCVLQLVSFKLKWTLMQHQDKTAQGENWCLWRTRAYVVVVPHSCHQTSVQSLL